MFKKPFRVKSQSVMKGSDRKKLRADIGKTFGGLQSDDLTEIIPNKEEVTTTKIYTHAGDNAFIYSVNKQPLLFEIDKQKILYPTVYLLWRYPELIYSFTTWPPVFRKLTEGADLMLPGLVLREEVQPNTFKHIEKGQMCSVSLLGNKAPVAVGHTLLSGSDFFDSGMKGKGIHPVHLLGDELWAAGDKLSPPDIEDDPLPEEIQGEVSGDEEEETPGEAGEVTLGDQSVEGGNAGGVDQCEQAEEAVDETQPDVEASGGAEELKGMEDLTIEGAETSEDNQNETLDNTPESFTPDQMDELLHFCFLCALKSSLRPADLPQNTGTFYKQHMMKFCPEGKHLDIKKSTYKKLSKFLQYEEKTGIIKVKETSKGVDSIVEMDKGHTSLRGFEAPEPTVAMETTNQAYTPPQITEMFAVTGNVMSLFKPLGYSKGSALKSGDVRKIVTEYVRSNNLQEEGSGREVQLDPILAEILLSKAEGDRATLKWEEILSRLLNKMSPVHEIVFQGQQPVVRKGNVEPIKIDVLQRASNKKVTVIENLEMFGIDPKEFGHTVQVKMACSASVTPSQQKNKGLQVVVQGNQINFIADLLVDTYKIPKKYMKGLDKAPKSKGRR